MVKHTRGGRNCSSSARCRFARCSRASKISRSVASILTPTGLLALDVQLLQNFFRAIAYAAHQKIPALEPVIHKVGHQMEVFHLGGIAHMDTGTAAPVDLIANADVVRIDRLRSRMFGNKIYIDAEIAVDGSINLHDAHSIAEQVHDSVEENFDNIKHIMIHVNPA